MRSCLRLAPLLVIFRFILGIFAFSIITDSKFDCMNCVCVFLYCIGCYYSFFSSIRVHTNRNGGNIEKTKCRERSIAAIGFGFVCVWLFFIFRLNACKNKWFKLVTYKWRGIEHTSAQKRHFVGNYTMQHACTHRGLSICCVLISKTRSVHLSKNATASSHSSAQLSGKI